MLANLHCHSEHSFLDGSPKIDQLVERATELGQTAIAVTDHGNVSGHLRLQRAARSAGIRPIFGMEGYFCDDRKFRETKKKGEGYEHITILAKNKVGLRNLWTLSSLGFIDGHHFDPRVDWELLERYREGLVVAGGCLGGCVTSFFNEDSPVYFNEEMGLSRLGRFKEIFGDDFLLEIHTWRNASVEKANHRLAALGRSYGIKLIACSDAHYLFPDEWRLHELLVASQLRKKFDDPTRYQWGPDALFFHSEADVRRKLDYLDDDLVHEAIANTEWVAERCDAEIETTRYVPEFYDAQTDVDKLGRAVLRGFKYRAERLNLSQAERDRYFSRLAGELNLVQEKGFSGYFLIVEDMVKWAKTNGILMGPSRGSVGGSLLAYVLQISEIDPMRLGISFDRFIDPGRESLPDIDLDFPDDDRHLVREYLESKYQVAAIGTMNTLAPKQLLRDFSFVLEIPPNERDQMGKIIGQVKDLGVSRLESGWININEEVGEHLRPWMIRYPLLFELMEKYQDHIRHSSAHAGGLVISQRSLIGAIPLRVQRGDLRTQFDMEDVEELGFVKFDLLGVRNLSTLARCRKLIPDVTPHYYDWASDWEEKYGDQKVMKSLWGGKNVGIFQLETEGLRHLIRRHKPKSLRDIADLIAVFRPGITRARDQKTGETLLELYMKRREGSIPAEYRHERLREVLNSTHGNFIYQDQIMKACEVLASYSKVEQDRIRKILGKMKQKEMVAERRLFVQRCQKNGIPADVAETIFTDMEPFGTYGFNLAHAAGYAMLAWWGAYQKHYWPHEYMTALFQTAPKKLVQYIREARRMGIEVLGPDVHESDSDFTLTPDRRIRYGLRGIKWVGGTNATIIQTLRPFTSLLDFYRRCPRRGVNSRVVETLAQVGALDSILSDAEVAVSPAQWIRRHCAVAWYWTYRLCEDRNQPIPDRLLPESMNRFGELLLNDLGQAEMEFMGLPISHDPVEPYLDLISSEDNYVGLHQMLEREYAKLGGIITKVKPLVTRKGRNPGRAMCQMWIERPVVIGDDEDQEDWADAEQVVVFPDEYSYYQGKIAAGVPVLARVQKLPGEGGLMLKRLTRLDEFGT